jgi:hypothetical protein
VIVAKIGWNLQCPDGVCFGGQDFCHLVSKCGCGRCIDRVGERSLPLVGLFADSTDFGTVRGWVDRRRWLGRACCCGTSEHSNCEARYGACAGAANR